LESYLDDHWPGSVATGSRATIERLTLNLLKRKVLS
jgi:hypothetical protein